MNPEQITELTTEAELRSSYPVMHQLRPVGEDEFVRLVRRMRDESGYRLFAVREGDGIRALVGVVVRTNLYHGRHAWIHDLVVDESQRGKGYGSEILSWVETWADERDCTCVELASGLWRDRAHRFYERVGMEKYCYTFKKDLRADTPH